MHKVIFDCDNTMGLEGKDVDDGLTLLYLLGRKDIELCGVTLTHGNGTIEEVSNNTRRVFEDLNLKHVKYYIGANAIENRYSEAAKFLAEETRRYPKDITILATGSMSNLYGAYLYDNEFFNNVKNIVIMGGLLAPLTIGNVDVKELNLSCDYEATFKVLTSGANITILNGHTSLQALFGEAEIEYVRKSNNYLLNYIYNNIVPWCKHMEEYFGIKGFCNWDAAAAIYITDPELFDENIVNVLPSKELLKLGYITLSEDGNNKINMPSSIKNLEEFNDILISSWEQLDL